MAAVAYTLLTLVLTYPLCLRMGSAVIHDPGDPILNTWLLWWNAHHVPLTAEWWNGPIFFPTSNTLAFSETLAGLSPLTSPIIWLTGQPLLAYNVAFVVSFVASALSAWWLVWVLTARTDAAFLAGLAFGFAPYRWDQLPHIQILATWWMPLALAAAHRYLQDGRPLWLAVLAASWALLGTTNGYVLLFFAVLFTLWMLWFTTHRVGDRLLPLLGAWALGVVPVVPILLKYREVHTLFEFQRPYAEMVSFSADLFSVVRGADLLALGHRWLLPQGMENNLYPGTVVGLGVPLALGWVWARSRRADREVRKARAVQEVRAARTDLENREDALVRPGSRAVTLAFGLSVVIATALSLVVLSIQLVGPWRVEWGPVVLSALDGPRAAGTALTAWLASAALSPWLRRLWRAHSVLGFYVVSTLVVWLLAMGPEIRWQGTTVVLRAPYFWLLRLPGFDGLRAPGRFAFLSTLTLAVCGGLLLARLVSQQWRWRTGLVVLLGIGIVADTWPSTMPLLSTPRPFRLLESSARGPILELPLGHAERDIASMYRQIAHGQPLVNGFSGYLAPYYDILAIALEEDRDHEVLQQLAARGVEYVVVDQRSDPDGVREQFVASSPLARFVARQEGHVLFALTDPKLSPTAGQDSSRRASVAAIADERGREVATGALIDGNPLTAWQSSGPQKGGERLLLTLSEAATLDALVITHGPYRGGFARRLVVETSLDGNTWTNHFGGRMLPLLVGGVMDDPQLGRVRIDLHRAQARFVRLSQEGETPRSSWAMADLDVYRSP